MYYTVSVLINSVTLDTSVMGPFKYRSTAFSQAKFMQQATPVRINHVIRASSRSEARSIYDKCIK